ncbi:MAG TPA: DsbA family oxidoreductase [Actinocrinis sp.]|nr:DsbA family oxidoreductase [Actinocrinis sp.]
MEIYADVACPWCYIGKHRFERALAAFPGAAGVEVVYRPYQLDPQAPAEATGHRAWLDQKYGPESSAMDARVAQLGEAEGIAFDFDRALHVNTLDAHRLLAYALAEGGPQAQAAVSEALYAARFNSGGNVGDHAQLARIAEQAGLDPAAAEAYLDSDAGTVEVLAQIDRARELGVQSVPTYVFDGRFAVEGAHETSTFLKVLDQVAHSE